MKGVRLRNEMWDLFQTQGTFKSRKESKKNRRVWIEQWARKRNNKIPVKRTRIPFPLQEDSFITRRRFSDEIAFCVSWRHMKGGFLPLSLCLLFKSDRRTDSSCSWGRSRHRLLFVRWDGREWYWKEQKYIRNWWGWRRRERERLTHNSLKAFERRIREEKMLLKSRPKKEEETVWANIELLSLSLETQGHCQENSGGKERRDLTRLQEWESSKKNDDAGERTAKDPSIDVASCGSWRQTRDERRVFARNTTKLLDLFFNFVAGKEVIWQDSFSSQDFCSSQDKRRNLSPLSLSCHFECHSLFFTLSNFDVVFRATILFASWFFFSS